MEGLKVSTEFYLAHRFGLQVLVTERCLTADCALAQRECLVLCGERWPVARCANCPAKLELVDLRNEPPWLLRYSPSQSAPAPCAPPIRRAEERAPIATNESI